MARTKASVGAKVSSGKSSKARCSAAPPPASTGSSGSNERTSRGNSGGGNPVCPRETPTWQKPITNFFICGDTSQGSAGDDEITASSSKPKPKRNIIHSDEETSPEKPKNTVLDETIELQPLTGESSHKIEEYYTKNGEALRDADHNEERQSGKTSDDGESDTSKVTATVGNHNGVVTNGHNHNNNVKGKGVGKKTKGKENISMNSDRKRERDDDESSSDSEHVNKKIKVD